MSNKNLFCRLLLLIVLTTVGMGALADSFTLKGKIIDEFDMVIAGHAMSEGLTVVTDNLKHFGRIPGLNVENWVERDNNII